MTEDICTCDMLCYLSETCTQLKGLEISGCATVDSNSTECTYKEFQTSENAKCKRDTSATFRPKKYFGIFL